MASAIAPGEIVLVLSRKEAKALKLVLDNVAGSPVNSPRGIIDDVKDVLEDQGIDIDWTNIDVETIFKHGYQTLRFMDGVEI